ncbi:MAG: hypothetical protein M3458_19170 [Acidobacteriota bacterium]|nr:hypothetical protein [Acidobacteriota bacterium]
MVIDYRASGKRLTELFGGVHFDATDPNTTKDFGLFDIRPKLWERFAPEALTPEGLPRDRQRTVQQILEVLCLDPKKTTEVSLPPLYKVYLSDVVSRAYRNTIGGVPTMDTFIRTAHSPRKEDREIGRDLAARLSEFASQSSLGHFLNSDREALDLRHVPLVYFDFRHAKNDPTLLLIGTMAVQMMMDRYLFAQDQMVGTFLHIDEVQAMTRWPVLAAAVEDVIRTAGKYNTHVTAGSQHPEDFTHPQLKSLAHNCEVKYLFPMPAAVCRRVFDLTEGQARMVASLKQGSEEYRDCALISPTVVGRIRLRYGAVDGRLFMEASTGQEKFAATDALSYLEEAGIAVPERVRRALELEPRAEVQEQAALMNAADQSLIDN